MLAVTVACLVMAGVRSIEPPAEPSFFDQLGIKYTGLNGMEDYLVAADLALQPQHLALLSFANVMSRPSLTPEERHEDMQNYEYPEGFNSKSSFLDGCQAIRKRIDPLLRAIQEGNSKSVTWLKAEDRTEGVPSSVSLALTRLSLSLRFAMEADMANGDTSHALTIAECHESFNRRVATHAYGEHSRRREISRWLCRFFDNHMSRFSLSDIRRIRKLSEEVTSQPICLKARVERWAEELAELRERKTWEEVRPYLLEGVNGTVSDAEFERVASRYSLEHLINGVFTLFPGVAADLLSVLNLPEFQQRTAFAKLQKRFQPTWPLKTEEGAMNNLVWWFIDFYDLSHSLEFLGRTRARLLQLHTYVEEYRLQHSERPDSLADCAPTNLLFDPCSNCPFVYKKISSGGYELYSEGFGAYKKIKLAGAERGDSSPQTPTVP